MKIRTAVLGTAFVTDKGDWVKGTVYETNDLVHTANGVYMSLCDENDTEPSVGSSAWRIWLDKAIINTAVGNVLEKSVIATAAANAAAERVETAVTNAKAATTDAKTATQAANEAAGSVDNAKEAAKTATAEAESVTAAAKIAVANANEATVAANVAANNAADVADHPTKIGDNGNWWKWSLEKQTYEDTNVVAKGGALYPTFKHEGNKLYLTDYPSQLAAKFAKRGNKLSFDIVSKQL